MHVSHLTGLLPEGVPARLSPLPTGDLVVRRERLLRLLDHGTREPLTQIVAPAGSGKSVLAAAWAQDAGMPVAWLPLEADHAAPERFWAAAAAALARAGVATPEPAGEADGGALRRELAARLSARDEPVALVLDDFHAVASTVAAELDSLLRHPVDTLRLLVLSRSQPPLRVGPLRLARPLVDVRAAALACTVDELQELLERAGVALPAPAARRLWARTEGWMAAARLAASALAASTSPVDDAELVDAAGGALGDFLAEEVVAPLPGELRDLLRAVAIAEELDGDLAEALAPGAGGEHGLRALIAAGALVTEPRRGRFRLHPMLAEHMRAGARARRPSELARLHSVAAKELAARDEPHRAVLQAIAAGDWPLAARIGTRVWVDLLASGRLEALTPLLHVPLGDPASADPRLALLRAALALDHGDGEPARAVLRARPAAEQPALELDLLRLALSWLSGDLEQARGAVAALARAPGVRKAVRCHALTTYAVVALWTGHPVEARNALREALAGAIEAGQPWAQFRALAHLASAESRCGDVSTADRRAGAALALAQEHGWTATLPALVAHLISGLTAAAQCRFAAAAEVVDRLRRVAQPLDPPLRAAAGLPQVVSLSAQNLCAEALDQLDAIDHALGEWPLDPQLADTLLAWRARMLAASGDPAGARALLEQALSREPASMPVAATLARMQVAEGEFEQARATIAPALADTGPAPEPLRIDLWMTEALALDGLLDHPGAAAALERALDGAEPGGLLRPFVAQGELALPLLRRASRTPGRHSVLVGRVLEMLEGRAPATNAAAGLAEPLTEREQQVLRYLPTRLSNGGIAAELYVSTNTVKTHLRSIYRKLEVDRRDEAVARARQMRLIGRN